MRQNVWKHIPRALLDILSHREGEDTAVRLVAEDSKTLACLRLNFLRSWMVRYSRRTDNKFAMTYFVTTQALSSLTTVTCESMIHP
jgi:hypothetical protein